MFEDADLYVHIDLTDDMRVKLGTAEEIDGAAVGFNRMANALRWNLKTKHEGNASLWAGHIEGANSEQATSIYTGLEWKGRDWLWTPENTEAPPDLGMATEVRWVAPRFDKKIAPLNFQPGRDREDRTWILVVGYAPTYWIVGMIPGEECKEKGRFKEYPERDLYRVPADKLTHVPRAVLVG